MPLNFSQLKERKTKITVSHAWFVGYLSLLLLELVFIHRVSDLPNILGNWSEKVEQLAALEIPKDNFYGPGAALLLLPFHILKASNFLAVVFYFCIGVKGYWEIASLLRNKKFRIFTLVALPANVYLIWLINSSQDMVFEFALLTWACVFLIRSRFVLFTITAFLLCETRAGYWVFFLGTGLLLVSIDKIKKRKIKLTKILVIPLLLVSSGFNFALYNSPSPALEGGITAYFSYSKYHYLSLPKMDMDVFLSGPKGIFSKGISPDIKPGTSDADLNAIYQEAAIESAKANKKETLLGWMQKFDSYFFDVQKVPHLPGSYVLDLSTKTIKIEDERLSWNLVLGNLAFEIQRTLLLTLGLLAAGFMLASRLLLERALWLRPKLWFLALPYFFGVVPGMLMYTETRFKIVSELLLVPLIAEIYSLAFQRKKFLKRVD